MTGKLQSFARIPAPLATCWRAKRRGRASLAQLPLEPSVTSRSLVPSLLAAAAAASPGTPTRKAKRAADASTSAPEARRREVLAILERLTAVGSISEEQLLLASQLVQHIPAGYKVAGNSAGALLILLSRAAGNPTAFLGRAGSAAEAVLGVGAAASTNGVKYHYRLCRSLWQTSPEWQRLLPASSLPACAILQQMAEQGQFPPDQLAPALVLVRDLGLDWGPRGAAVAGALFLLFSHLRGVELVPEQGAAAVQSTGNFVTSTTVKAALFSCCARWKESSMWQDVLGPVIDKPARREDQLQQVLEQLCSAGRLDARQLATARQLLPRLRSHGGRAGTMAAALLVVLENAEGRELSSQSAIAAVHGMGVNVSRRTEMLVPELVRIWKSDPDWQRLLGPPTRASPAFRLRAQLTATFHKLCSQGSLPQAELALACQLVGSLDISIHRYLRAGVLAASMLVVLSVARNSAISPAIAVVAVKEAGLEAGVQAVQNQLPMLQEHWQDSGAWQELIGAPKPTSEWHSVQSSAPQGQPLNLQLLDAFRQLSSGGFLTPAEHQLACQLAGSLPVQRRGRNRKAGVVAASLLMLLAAARGCEMTPITALAAVHSIGLDGTELAVTNQFPLLQQHWENSVEWQQLLGPAKPLQRARKRLGVNELLGKLVQQGYLQPAQLLEAVQLAEARLQAAPVYVRGNLAGGVLLVVTAPQGSGAMAAGDALAAVQACGGSATEVGIQKEWMRCRWLHRAGSELQQLLERLAVSGQLPQSQVAPLAELAATLRLAFTRTLTPGVLAAALLVILAYAHCRQLPVTHAVRIVNQAGSSAAATRVTRVVMKCKVAWKGSPNWQQVLGPYPVSARDAGREEARVVESQ